MEEEEKQAKAEAERQAAIKNKVKFIRARHILHEDEDVIKEAIQQMGEAPTEDQFARYAEELSQCPSNAKGGLLGYFGKG